jgi:tetratricopeptide (TPR) repeat protein
MADRYAGTRAGTEGRIFLAEMLYDQKQFKEGIAELKSVEKGSGDFAASVHVLEANGYEELRDFASAAAHYKEAAEVARFPYDSNQYKAAEARDLMTAGRRAEALVIWQELAKDPTSPFALEAKLRIGELTAAPAKV